ncbi:hypothetical protein AB9P05_05620 [Roseivirga sp. BDSF3-8]|uniref:hypothetical protein n=1 Tax=Roseivirga sp. BDSF3-8 TaxID=3241598 RepID=UPI00353235A0
MKNLYFIALLLVLCLACGPDDRQDNKPEDSNRSEAAYGNPPADGFDKENSSEKAIAIADTVMATMGGRQAWDETEFIEWTFFGRRKLLWDKENKRVRIDFTERPLTIITNIEGDPAGKVWKDSTLVENADTLQKYLQQGRSIWINDAYWLVMPYKMKDSGVTLTHLREDTLQGGAPADVLEMTFNNVGDTPENRYEVWVSKEEPLVRQWAYFPTAEADTPRFVTPWQDYQQYGEIRLSSDRGMARLTDIAVYDSLPADRFEEL